MNRNKETIIGKRIRYLRNRDGSTVKELADKLQISASALSNYEYGFREPNGKALAALERYFGVSAAYLHGETDIDCTAQSMEQAAEQPFPSAADAAAKLMDAAYHQISELPADSQIRKEYLAEILEELRHVLNKKEGVHDLNTIRAIFYSVTRFCDIVSRADRGEDARRHRALDDALHDISESLKRYAQSVGAIGFVERLTLRVSDQPASAGTGAYLGPEAFSEREVDSTPLTRSALFGVPVRGDSMEPKYHDGDIILVGSATDVQPGDVVLATLDNCGYVKQLGNGELLSFNPAYSPIKMDDSIIINGKVIGVLPSEK